MSESSIVALLNSFPSDGSEDALRGALAGYLARDLRTACSSLRIQPQGKARSNQNNKAGYITLLCEYWQARQDGVAVTASDPPKPDVPSASTRRTKHCFFRLANVIFSESFAVRLHEMDASPSRYALDVGAVNAYNNFWQDVEAAFASKNPEFDSLVVNRVEYAGINPSLAPQHYAVKLREMWRMATGNYTTSLANSRQSGTHTSDFFDFCAGKLEALYLHDWLRRRPSMLSTVERKLPKRARLDTLESSGEIDNTAAAGNDQNVSTPAKKRLKVLDRIADLLESQKHAEQMSTLSSSLQKARVVKEWAFAIEILTRTGDASDTVHSIRAAIDKVMKSAAAELAEEHQDAEGDEALLGDSPVEM
ncbi:hypothetical protein GN958_ATG12198 [Phytophthora infestans]|uniref:Uncharacterized protein n=1 Tax=Phytophthora infestans TaxID=4787 RepID=A0A8S9UDM7_PHYIN|nr:hypothetical protein GN958_ATG12198 [Phytophthora infestans]